LTFKFVNHWRDTKHVVNQKRTDLIDISACESLAWHKTRCASKMIAGAYKHLLQQAAFEGLGVDDLLGHVFDLAVEGGEEVRDLGLFGKGWNREQHIAKLCL
jgi:hypothetical protein